VDLASVAEALAAAKQAQARHFVYVSVAHPAPVMRTYVAARREAEELVRASGIPATILRPWYVLGPGHRWPLLLLPAYALASLFPGSRETARRLGLVTRARMVRALADSVEHPAAPLRVLGVPDIRAAGAFPFPSSPNPIGAAHAWIRRATRSLPAAGSTP
ncbi:MAG TPA: NAD(P)H-binding protein, partial [Longimicrobium sp.]|nr:NAD(P)H-binding protein [Longimicrobium sp.]